MADERFKEAASQRLWVYNIKCGVWSIPEEPGVYLIVFGNKKRYLGSTNNLRKRLFTHLGCLCGKNHKSTKWYKRARVENELPLYEPAEIKTKIGRKKKSEEQLKAERDEESGRYFQFLKKIIINKVQISYCICDDYGEYEDYLLKLIEERDMWYNSQFCGNNKRRER